MTVNSRLIGAPLEAVHSLILQPEHYSYWVVGPQVVESVDASWPAVGSGFSTKLSLSGLALRGRTTLVDVGEDRIKLDVELPPFVRASVTLILTELPGGTQVTMEEETRGGLAALGGPVGRAALKLRNAESLARLEALVERKGSVASGSPRSTISGAAVFDSEAIAHLLATADACYLGTNSSIGAHVTPTRFVTFADRLWAIVGSNSAKASALKQDPVIGVTARTGDRYVVIQGEAVVFDPTSLRPPVQIESALLAPALARYLIANRSEVLTWGRALLGAFASGSAGGVPTVISVRPIGGLLVGPSGIEGAFGRWIDRPIGIEDGTGEGTSALLGWKNDEGVVVLPASWNSDRKTASVRPSLIEAVRGRDDAASCIVFDDVEKHLGLMYRGHGRLERGTRTVEVTFDADRVTYWDGVETGTVGREVVG